MIIGVAIKHRDIMICLPKPNRHHDCIRYACDVLGIKPPICGLMSSQGFYTSDGVFLDRKEGLAYVKLNNQLINKQAHTNLFSEDLW